jgi:hypothetical protein
MGAGEQRVEHQPQREQVGSARRLRAAAHLGRRPRRRLDRVGVLRVGRGPEGLRGVDQRHAAAAADDDVARVDASVRAAARVQRSERASDLAPERDRIPDR